MLTLSKPRCWFLGYLSFVFFLFNFHVASFLVLFCVTLSLHLFYYELYKIISCYYMWPKHVICFSHKTANDANSNFSPCSIISCLIPFQCKIHFYLKIVWDWDEFSENHRVLLSLNCKQLESYSWSHGMFNYVYILSNFPWVQIPFYFSLNFE